MAIPINPKKLLESDLIERERLELKKGFNPKSIIHTMCAFANDFNNWGGGYILIGIKNNKKILGLNHNKIDTVMKKLIELSNKIRYPYFPIVEPFKYKRKHIIIIYCPGGPARPYKAPKKLGKRSEYRYYIRRNASTVIANHEEEKELISMSNKIPFDDQINHKATMNDLDFSLIKKYLEDIHLNLNELSKKEICRSLNIGEGPKEYFKPKNIGLLMFSENPKKFIKTPWTEITIFFDNVGDKFEEKVFEGNIVDQIRNSLDYIKTKVISERVQKVKGQAESLRYFNYPYQAIEEALVNAVYHKSYEIDVPIEVRVELNRIDIISYPGPLPPLNKDNLNDKVVISKKYRNRRIGEFLKEYDLTEQKNTGFRKIRNALNHNNSPEPEFITDEDRTYFITRIHIHEDFKDLQREAQAEAQAEAQEDIKILELLDKEILSVKEILAKLGKETRSGSFKKLLKTLINDNLIVQTIPDKPKSPNQKYKITKKGLKRLANEKK